ncbi:MAG: calcineurin-like phosphoesterase family protein [Acidobacteriota bacterium]
MNRKGWNRRQFLTSTGQALSVLGAIGSVRAQIVRRPPPAQERYIRVRGLVRSGETPLAGVSVSDGLSVARTDARGEFELIAGSAASFIFVSLPSGYRIPTGPNGTARLYRPLDTLSDETVMHFHLQPLETSDDHHGFFLLADPQTEDLEEMRLFREQTIPDLRRLSTGMGGELFAVACGDLMYDHLELFDDYESTVRLAGLPFFQVVGNHDVNQDVWVDFYANQTFEHHFGPSNYSFERGAVHYVVLDDVFWHGDGYIGYLTDAQLAWLAADLGYVEPGRTVIVFLHIPLFNTGFRRAGSARPSPESMVLNRDALYELLAPDRVHVLSGHTHENEHVFEGGVHEQVHGTVCGAWWTGPVCSDGTPCGYGVYDVRGEEIRWRYKSTGRDLTEQMRIYPWGADPSAPDEIVANVWNWDPQWEVTWYEDGRLKGPMVRRRGYDPLAVKLYSGERLPVKRPWVDPRPTDHLFYAPAHRRATEVRVDAKDRFGVTYSAVLRA